jgi:peptidoglycan/LPS O-acetylase OafA/YrhL
VAEPRRLAKAGDIPALTGLRGVAAYTVLFAHALDFAFGGRYHAYVVGLAYFGMSLFFVLSGFVIHYNYAAIRGLSGSYRFFVARFARLYPLYLLLLVFIWTFFPDPPPYDGLFVEPLAGVAALTLTQTWINVGAVPTMFGQSWSISTEWFFYAAFPFLALVPIRKPWPVLLIFLVLAFAALSVLFVARDAVTALISPFVRDQLPYSAPPWLWLTYFGPWLRLLEFIAGILACRAYLELRGRTFDLAGPVLSICLAGMAALLLVSPFAGNDGWAVDMLRSFVFAVFMAPALMAICAGPSTVARLLASRPFELMGEISYSVYALQFLVLGLLTRHVAPGPAYFLTAVVVVTGLSVATYWLYERPARLILRRVLMPLPRPRSGAMQQGTTS